MSGSTKNDCARGSYHPTIVSDVVGWPIFLVATTSVPKVLLIGSSANNCLFSMLAFLIDRIWSWTVSIMPEVVYACSPIVVAAFWSLSGSFVNVNTLVPVSNLGLSPLLGSGINKLPIKAEDVSLISLTLVTSASAPLVFPLRIIPVWMLPKKFPCGWFERE